MLRGHLKKIASIEGLKKKILTYEGHYLNNHKDKLNKA